MLLCWLGMREGRGSWQQHPVVMVQRERRPWCRMAQQLPCLLWGHQTGCQLVLCCQRQVLLLLQWWPQPRTLLQQQVVQTQL